MKTNARIKLSLAFLLTLIMVLGIFAGIGGTKVLAAGTEHSHPICGATCIHEGDGTHASIEWQALPAGFTGGTLAEGNYYLTKNISLTESIYYRPERLICMEVTSQTTHQIV